MLRLTRTTEGLFLRTGRCNRCGDCCRTGDPTAGTMPPGPVEGACPIFRLLADGRGLCSDRQSETYLRMCADAPSDRRQLAAWPRCSYRFFRVPGRRYV